MKFVFVIFISLVVYVKSENDELLNKWQEYQVKFEKSYRSPVENRRRLSIFKNNLETIEAHNILFENGVESYEMGINQFADWTREEFMAYVNKGLVDKPMRFGSEVFKHDENEKVSEASVDWREKGGVSPVKDQGSCGSCWAFSAIASIESLLLIKKNDKTTLSEQQLVDCSGSQGSDGCDGGLNTEGYEYIMKMGIESEKDYPYIDKDGDCNYRPSKIHTKITKYIDIKEGDESGLKKALTKSPVAVSMEATDKFQHYSSGILTDDTCNYQNEKLNHDVLAIGYGSENGKKYYIIKNSWGDDWGENGFLRLAEGRTKACGVATMATFPVL